MTSIGSTLVIPAPTSPAASPSPGHRENALRPAPDRRHLDQLDVLRGLAILSVLLFHSIYVVYHHHQELGWRGLWRTTSADLPPSFYVFYPLQFGKFGVFLFFVLSGFVIHYSFLNNTKSKFSAVSFYVRRFWRIYPPYLLAMTFFFAWQWKNGISHVYLYKQYLLHALAIHNFHHQSIFELSAAFWSLAVEIQFYLLYPVIVALRSRIGMERTLYAVLLVSVLANAFGFAVTDWSKLSYPIWYGTLNMWFDWMLGAYLAEQYYNRKRMFSRPILTSSILVLVLVVSTFYEPTSVLTHVVASVLSAILIELCLWTNVVQRIPNKFLISLGICSYSFYLWHQPLLDVFFSKLRIDRLPNEWEQFIVLNCVALVIMFVFSNLLYVTVEKGSQRLGKWVAKAFSPRRALEMPGDAPVLIPDPAVHLTMKAQ